MRCNLVVGKSVNAEGEARRKNGLKFWPININIYIILIHHVLFCIGIGIIELYIY
jgi:hypothetical protein